MERNVKRGSANLEYLKNVFVKFLETSANRDKFAFFFPLCFKFTTISCHVLRDEMWPIHPSCTECSWPSAQYWSSQPTNMRVHSGPTSSHPAVCRGG